MAEVQAGNAQAQIKKVPGPQPANQANNPKKGKKKAKKPVNPFAIICILLVVLLLGFAACAYFDLFNMKQVIVDVLKLESPTKGQLAELEAQQKELDLNKQEFTKTSTEQKKTASEQKKTASDLDKREKAVADAEAAAKTKQEELDALQKQLDTKQVDLKATVAMFEKMDATKAAPAISAMKNINDMAMILSGMASDKSAAILNNMDAKIATKVLNAVVAQNKTP